MIVGSVTRLGQCHYYDWIALITELAEVLHTLNPSRD